MLDSVRARNTSLHNYERQTTPFLEKFAERATWYTQARAPGVGSLQSHASIFTGLHAEQHRLVDGAEKLAAGHTIWEELAEQGYNTGVFSYNSYLTQAPVGLKDAFEVVESGDEQRIMFPDAYDPNDLESNGPDRYIEFLQAILKNDKPIKSLCNGITHWKGAQPLLPDSLQGDSIVPDRTFTDLFLQWQENSDEPWAACVNYMGAHSPYLPDEPHDKWASRRDHKIMDSIEDVTWSFISGEIERAERTYLENLYDGCIHQVDAEVERLITELETRNKLDDTLVVITSDHGEGFGEEGQVRPVRSIAHGNTGGPEEQILHVPLLVHHPSQTRVDQVDQVASLTLFPDVVKKVLNGNEDELLFVPDNGKVLASMSEYSSADRERLPDFVTEEDYTDFKYGSRIVYETTDQRKIKKYVKWNGKRSAFDCTKIPTLEVAWSRENIIDDEFNSLKQIDVLEGSTEELSKEVENRLEQLGYR